MTTTTTDSKATFKPSSVIIFEEADGFHWSHKGLNYLDARGKGHKSRSAAIRAARENFEAGK